MLAIMELLLLMTACAEDPAANKPKATVTETNQSAPADNDTKPAVGGEELTINGENSKVEFTGSKVTGHHDGGFKNFTGTVNLVDGKVEGSTVKVEIDMASVFTDDEGLTTHLKNQDFFEVPKFPKSTFNLTKIEADTTKGADNYMVSGELELRGVKKGISFPAEIKVSDAEVTVNADFAINRKDFGVNYAGMANDLIRDDVAIRLDLKAPRKK